MNRVRVAPRAAADLEAISRYLRANASADVSARIGARFEAIFERLAEMPNSGTRASGRVGLRVVFALPYPYRIFYRVTADAVEIVHIRHTSRAPL